MLNSINSSHNLLSKFGANLRVKQNTSSQSPINSSTQANTNEVLGYKVDKDGYFTEEFNKVAGIPKDYKIHSTTMQSLVNKRTTPLNELFPASFTSVDIAKTAGNAYKIVSQLLEQSPELASKESFSKQDLANFFPQNYKINTQSGEITQVYSYEQVKQIVANGGFKGLSSDEAIIQSFFDADNGEGSSLKPFDTDILSGGLFLEFEINAKHYTNEKGEISKGGLLMGFLNKNLGKGITHEPLIVGETTIAGKISGFDSSLSEVEIQALSNFISENPIMLDKESLKRYSTLMNSNMSVEEFKAEYAKLSRTSWQNVTQSSNNIDEIIKAIENSPQMKALKYLLGIEDKDELQNFLQEFKSLDLRA